MTLPDIHGVCPPRFAAVKDAFAANFTDAPEGLNERGARFSVVIDGEAVIDLWGGWADTAQSVPFGEDTLTPVFSAGKSVMALLIATCVERGLLDYEAPVAGYWPAFGQAGKARITVGQLMSHQAGLSGFAEAIDPTDWFNRAVVLEKLCAQAPLWAPGTASGYHPITIGYLAGELYRLVDGRSMGTALRQDFPGLDLWIGLPEEEFGRVAQMRKPAAPPNLGVIDAVKRSAFFDRGSSPGQRESGEWRKAEIPSANLHGTALDLARIVGVAATGAIDGRTVLSDATLEALRRERIYGQDRVLPFVMGWAAGLTCNRGLGVFGPHDEARGHYGWGGSCVVADAEVRLSAAYVMTRQSPHLIGDPRAVRLLDALYSVF
ncbi:serine hydrolase domain-containing protein [Brevundimonas lenta]|uniref:CubicO group peptidase (Beta-lactamase class C family) n=1 Tax=Brevundimonas lenta TaxID=424796 RepID=A0A7W6JA24_9CAUL|nr:serine hydrolase domain-containing protein [Brevundimonas lenta]MBB4081321.1 CubicO group peptidase (beta-lactamase class C family) [Brevundimonas lenta]